jgi:hypothetical protein
MARAVWQTVAWAPARAELAAMVVDLRQTRSPRRERPEAARALQGRLRMGTLHDGRRTRAGRQSGHRKT